MIFIEQQIYGGTKVYLLRNILEDKVFLKGCSKKLKSSIMTINIHLGCLWKMIIQEPNKFIKEWECLIQKKYSLKMIFILTIQFNIITMSHSHLI